MKAIRVHHSVLPPLVMQLEDVPDPQPGDRRWSWREALTTRSF